jgi:hypothetical protein
MTQSGNAGLDTHLKTLEEALLSPGTRQSERQLRALLADDFREFGKSGRTFSLAMALSELPVEARDLKAEISDFEMRVLADDVALVTYRVSAQQPDGARASSLRSSIWKRDTLGHWRMLFHQGTPAAE